MPAPPRTPPRLPATAAATICVDGLGRARRGLGTARRLRRRLAIVVAGRRRCGHVPRALSSSTAHSRSCGQTLRPLIRIRSLLRPVITKAPPLRYPRSPVSSQPLSRNTPCVDVIAIEAGHQASSIERTCPYLTAQVGDGSRASRGIHRENPASADRRGQSPRRPSTAGTGRRERSTSSAPSAAHHVHAQAISQRSRRSRPEFAEPARNWAGKPVSSKPAAAKTGRTRPARWRGSSSSGRSRPSGFLDWCMSGAARRRTWARNEIAR